jgi:phenylalanyl-tRNA synthetase beta subunit
VFEFCFQDANGTLTDNIVNKQINIIFNHLAKCFKAKLRK